MAAAKNRRDRHINKPYVSYSTSSSILQSLLIQSTYPNIYPNITVTVILSILWESGTVTKLRVQLLII